jgi:hypothetical protein
MLFRCEDLPHAKDAKDAKASSAQGLPLRPLRPLREAKNSQSLVAASPRWGQETGINGESPNLLSTGQVFPKGPWSLGPLV